MDRVLTAREATIQTVQVEIQTLRVGKKQVTQALFKQLPHEPLIDPETVQLRGVPWGHVRYWWEGDGTGFGHGPNLHVVWQLGDTLRRAIVFEEPHPRHMTDYQNQLLSAYEDLVLVCLPQAKQFEIKRSARFQTDRDVHIDSRVLPVRFDDAQARILTQYWHYRDLDPEAQAEADARQAYPDNAPDKILAYVAARYPRLREAKEEAVSAYRRWLQTQGLLDMLPQMMEHRVREIRAEREAYKDAWAKQWQTLSQLPQLFIAV